MDNGIDNIKRLFNELKTFTLWDRLFHWGRIRTLLVETSAELQRLVSGMGALQAENRKLESSIERLSDDKITFQKENSVLKEKNDNYLKRGTEVANEKESFKNKADLLDRECNRLREEILQLKTKDEQRRTEHERAINQLVKLREDILKERHDKDEKEKQAAYEKLRRLKETWSKHEADVKNRIKIICNRHGVEYLETVPFKGKPDNTLKINDEFIVFDAKSPGSDDLSNFPLYLRNQAESVSKYVKEENVRREVFLVVPTNTLDVVEQFEYKLSDYTVYVISIDALEPIILSLRKIEDYEFAEQQSPA